MGEFCNKGTELEAIKQQIIAVKSDLDEHREAQRKIDAERYENRKKQKISDETMARNLAMISAQIGAFGKQLEDLIELNSEVGDLKTAWKVGKRIGLGLTVVIASLSVIFGGIYAIKEWIKK